MTTGEIMPRIVGITGMVFTTPGSIGVSDVGTEDAELGSRAASWVAFNEAATDVGED
jgi:hypothetical protein